MEAEAAVQLNLGFESSRENIGPFASNHRDQDQDSFLGKRFSGSRSFAQNLLLQVDQLWKVIIALAVLIFVLFASIAMLVHFASKVSAGGSSSVDSNHPTASHFKFDKKSVSTSDAYSPPPPAPVLMEKRPEPAIVVNSTLILTTPSLQITNQQTVNMSTNDTTEESTSKEWSSPCGLGWTPYRDERCFRLFTGQLKTFEEAVEVCQREEASLLTVRYPEEQAFLTEWLYREEKQFDCVWLGAQWNQVSGKFSWLTGEAELRYVNWVVGPLSHPASFLSFSSLHPHFFTLANEENEQQQQGSDKICAHLTAYEGKWDIVPCIKLNLVVCERLQSWTFLHFQRLFLATRKTVEEQLKREVMPLGVGFTYAQLSTMPAPAAIWPHMSWEEVTPERYYNPYVNNGHIRFWKRTA